MPRQELTGRRAVMRLGTVEEVHHGWELSGPERREIFRLYPPFGGFSDDSAPMLRHTVSAKVAV